MLLNYNTAVILTSKFSHSDLATHIDGFVACAAHTLVVGANKENPVTGRKADVIKAAYYMSEAQIRVVKPDNKVSYDFMIKLFSKCIFIMKYLKIIWYLK